MYFRLAPHIYAGRCNEDIIILDVEKNQYLSITDKGATVLQSVLENEFVLENGTYICAVRDKETDADQPKMIDSFLEHKFIEVSEKRCCSPLPTAQAPGGLANYVWDYKASLAPFSRTSKVAILRAFINLLKIEFAIKRNGIKGVLKALEKAYKPSKKYDLGNDKLLQELSDSVDIACSIYPKKVYCLGWAATFTLVALKRGIRAHLVIGVQNLPFYAHAWAEVDGKVVNDDEKVKKYLTPLLAAPFDEQIDSPF